MKRLCFTLWRARWTTITRHTYVHDLLRTCGVENVFADRERHFPLAADLGEAPPLTADDPRIENQDTPYPRLSLDEVVAAQPELGFLPGGPHNFTQPDGDQIPQ